MTVNILDAQFTELVQDILKNGVTKIDRTGVGTREVFARQLRVDLSLGMFPLLTTKMIRWKAAFGEMLWMLSGSNNIRPLLEQNINIWTDWPLKKYIEESGEQVTRKEFSARILGDDAFAEKWGNTGGAYGVQWRTWDTYKEVPVSPSSAFLITGNNQTKMYIKDEPLDQVQQCIETIKRDPDSRRIIFTAWNPPALGEMMLPPCHTTYQFQISEGKLNLFIYQRSWDVFLGGPFNIANGALLCILMAHQCGLEPGELVVSSVCTHLYTNALDASEQLVQRLPKTSPTLEINHRGSLFDYSLADLQITNYDHHPEIKVPVAV